MNKLQRRGKMAWEYLGVNLPLEVQHSAAGYYLGTVDEDGPCTRESLEYFATAGEARTALETNNWTQRETP